VIVEVFLTASWMSLAQSRAASQSDFSKKIARAQQEHSKRQAAHREERINRGLSPQAGTGTPERGMAMYRSVAEELPYEDRPGGASLNQMIRDIETAKVERDATLLAKLPLGASRVGGLPDLPGGVEWPTYLAKKLPFLVQINLSDLPTEKNRLLPRYGWLFAFGLFDNEPEHKPDPVKVFIHRGDAASLVRASRPDEATMWQDWGGQRIYELVPVTFVAPPKEVRELDAVGQRAGWLFSKIPDIWQTTPGEIADEAFRDGDDWISVLALESIGSMQWSDAGELFLVARRSSIERGDFSDVLSAICSS
jgi:hypothetical protein